MTMAYCQLGTLRWRIDPTDINWSYQLDTAVINTLGGQVVQILGATLSDMTISGNFGHAWRGSGWTASGGESWQLANYFHNTIRGLMDQQLSLPHQGGGQSALGSTHIRAENTSVHQPWTLNYSDGVHNWTFKVLVKGITDPDGDSLDFTNGKFNHQYQLTLFIVQAGSDAVQTIAVDPFISRIAKGVGWSKASFHGITDLARVESIIMANGGSISQMLAKDLGGEALTPPPQPAGP
jgi:hypothetical protein